MNFLLKLRKRQPKKDQKGIFSFNFLERNLERGRKKTSKRKEPKKEKRAKKKKGRKMKERTEK